MAARDEHQPTRFMAPDSYYDKLSADIAVAFINCLKHPGGEWSGEPFALMVWQETIIRDIFGVKKPNGYRQFHTSYTEIPKKQGKSELAAAVALFLTCADREPRAEVDPLRRIWDKQSPGLFDNPLLRNGSPAGQHCV